MIGQCPTCKSFNPLACPACAAIMIEIDPCGECGGFSRACPACREHGKAVVAAFTREVRAHKIAQAKAQGAAKGCPACGSVKNDYMNCDVCLLAPSCPICHACGADRSDPDPHCDVCQHHTWAQGEKVRVAQVLTAGRACYVCGGYNPNSCDVCAEARMEAEGEALAPAWAKARRLEYYG